MTIKEYLGTKFTAFNVSEADFTAMAAESGLDILAEYNEDNAQEVGVAMCGLLGELILAPHTKSISESGFSVTWDTDNVGKYYKYLCSKYNVKPNPEVLSLLGINYIRDVSDRW